jgi:hypothetical protein
MKLSGFVGLGPVSINIGSKNFENLRKVLIGRGASGVLQLS